MLEHMEDNNQRWSCTNRKSTSKNKNADRVCTRTANKADKEAAWSGSALIQDQRGASAGDMTKIT
jgi:hypothetical protein